MIFWTVFILGLAGLLIGYKMWNQPFKNALSGQAIQVTAEELLHDFQQDEQKAREKYVPEGLSDKVLEVSGEVKEVKSNEAGTPIILLKAGDEFSDVKTVFEKGEEISQVKAGDKIRVRGYCNGFLADELIPGMAQVIINRCRIVKD